MYRRLLPFLVLLFSAVFPVEAEERKFSLPAPPAILLDMDFGNGIDDAMTLRLFLLAAQRGEINPLAVTLSNPSEWTAPATRYLMDTLLPGYALPLGICHEDIGLALEDYTRPLAGKHGLQPEGGEDALKVLRRVLSAAPDHSVRVVCTGFGTNLAALLESQEDGVGELSGIDLVRNKVELLVLMAGISEDLDERNFNVIHNIGAFRTVVEDWPSSIYFVTPNLGEEVLLNLEQQMTFLPTGDPFRELVGLFKERKSFRHDPCAIPSWDQVAFLFAAYPSESLYTGGPSFRLTVAPNGVLKAIPGETADPPRYPLIRANGVTPEKVSSVLMERYQNKQKPSSSRRE